jgi:hypothetical protein
MSNEHHEEELQSLADSLLLFGAPPVLSTENLAYYKTIWSQLTAHFKPRDIVELMLIRNLVDATWESQRYIRQRTLSVERRFRTSAEFQQQRAAEIAKRRDQEIRRLAEKMGVPPSDFLLKCQMDSELEDLLIDTEHFFERIPTELDHARALESAIEYHERLEKLLTGALDRRDGAIAMLDQYSAGLGKRLREESDKIVAGASKGIADSSPPGDAPSIAPSDTEGSS